jgi:hypothetical protein
VSTPNPMTLEEALVSFLMADTAVTALIGTNFFPDSAPQGQTANYVVYHRLSTEDEQTLAASIDQPTADMELDFYAATRAGCMAIEKALRESKGGQGGLRLKEFFGTLGTVPGVQVLATVMQVESGGYTPTIDMSGRPAQMGTLAFRMTYAESTVQAPGIPVAPGKPSVTFIGGSPPAIQPGWGFVGGATFYKVYRRLQQANLTMGPMTYYATVGNVNSYLDSGVATNIYFSYAVTACNAAGESPQSPESNQMSF